jgi:hypothetical protein
VSSSDIQGYLEVFAGVWTTEISPVPNSTSGHVDMHGIYRVRV